MTNAITQIITRRRSSPRCSPSVMLSGDGRLFRLAVKGRVTTWRAAQLRLGSPGTMTSDAGGGGGPSARIGWGAGAGVAVGSAGAPVTSTPPFVAVGGWNEPSGASSEDIVDRWLSRADGDRARRAISEVGGRSGMELRTSDSMR